MVVPPNFEEGKSTYKPPRFNGQYNGWWKTRIHNFMMVEYSELWDIICDGPHVPMKKLEETRPLVPKGRREYIDIDRKVVEKNYRAKKILMCGIGLDEYNRVSACDTTKEIWEALQTAHEGTTQVKQSKIDMLTTEYELFGMKDDESIQYMYTRFTSIINELLSLEDVIPKNKLLRKILSVLPGSWESKVNAIIEAKDLQTLTMDELIDNIIKQALAAGVDSSSESERESDAENSSIMVVETEATKYDSLFTLMAQSNDDDDDDEDDKVNFRDVQRNLKSYSSKKLRSLSNVLIDAYYSLVNDKEIMTVELGEAEQSRDDLMICVVDLNETIANLEQEKEALNERITSAKNERDDLMVVVVDLKETIESLSNEKHTLEEKIAFIEEERDDLLMICTDIEEIMEGLNREHMNVSFGKGKEVASESHIMLEKELTVVKTSLCSELERNQQLQTELEKVRNDPEKSLKWTWSSDAVTAMYLNNSGNKQGIGFQREKTPYNPHNKCWFNLLQLFQIKTRHAELVTSIMS
ncbi:MAR-binding filament-like protein 1 [Nicotiana sylvestris]|uniref:MAR-binding filament-like protein 1 n=1 Tax=Nicotiana sylvestris TaxID=4096 RepID=UPI00388CD634